jgi:hypothetical protein
MAGRAVTAVAGTKYVIRRIADDANRIIRARGRSRFGLTTGRIGSVPRVVGNIAVEIEALGALGAAWYRVRA